MSDRRQFLKTVGAAGAAALASAGSACRKSGALAGGTDSIETIGVQLYTVRQAMAEDFEGTLSRIAEIGYEEVEFAGYFGKNDTEVRVALDEAGLVAPSAHVSYAQLSDDWARTIDAAWEMGHDYLICPGLPRSERSSLDGYRRVADVFNRAAEQALQESIAFGYHNHAQEFVPIDGQVPYDVLLAETDSETVLMQMDLFWILRGGRDPLEYFDRYPGRFHSVHVKDMDGLPDGDMVDVGQGNIDFAAIFARREQAGIRHFFVEHDEPAEQFESIRVSYEYLRGLRF